MLSADGTQLVYQLQVSNTGPSPAADVTVTDALAGKLTFVSATSTKGSCPRVGKYPDVHQVGDGRGRERCRDSDDQAQAAVATWTTPQCQHQCA